MKPRERMGRRRRAPINLVSIGAAVAAVALVQLVVRADNAAIGALVGAAMAMAVGLALMVRDRRTKIDP